MDTPAIVPADVAWMLVATALVLLMTPALALLLRRPRALEERAQHDDDELRRARRRGRRLGARRLLARVRAGHAAHRRLSTRVLHGVGLEPQGTIPHVLFMAYQGTFAIITAALISGAIVERMRFAPTSSSSRSGASWSTRRSRTGSGAAAGSARWARSTSPAAPSSTSTPASAALVAAIVIGPRKDYARQAILPHNVPFVLLGAGLLWFGWFGFNAGSALAANGVAALAFVNTMLAPAGDARGLDARSTSRAAARRPRSVRRRRSSSASSPSRRPPASSSPLGALALGALAALPSYFALLLRARTRLDDSLDVVAAHGVGGTVGALLTGVFASKAWNGTVDGLLFGNPGSSASRPSPCWRRSRYSAVATLRAAEARRPRDAARASRRRKRASASTSASTARRPTPTAKARS